MLALAGATSSGRLSAQSTQISGVVEVLNDAMYQPFLLSREQELPRGSRSSEIAMAVPRGKRLVIESVSARADIDRGGTVRITLRSQSFTTPLALATQPSAAGRHELIGNHPLTIRITGNNSTSDLRLRIERDSAAVLTTWSIAISGYYVDL
jgi:hypothetical protein